MRPMQFAWLATTISIGLLGCCGGVAAAGKVYVANEAADTVSVIDATSFRVLTPVQVGKMPHNVQLSPDGRLVWVTNNGELDMAAAPTHPGMDKAEHAVTAKPGAVWLIDTGTDAVIAKIPVGLHPAHVVLTPNGRFAYITNGGDNSVTVIDAAARSVVATIPVGKFPHGLRFTPDGNQAWVANLKGGTVPTQLSVTPDSRILLVANQGSRSKPGKTVSMIDLQTFKLIKTVVTAAGAHGVAIDREGRLAYITNTYANTVSVIDIKKRAVVSTIRVGKGPNGVSASP